MNASCPTLYIINATTTTETYTLSLHDALPIFRHNQIGVLGGKFLSSIFRNALRFRGETNDNLLAFVLRELDRKSTRLNSSHMSISYAVFCLKKKKPKSRIITRGRKYSLHPYVT